MELARSAKIESDRFEMGCWELPAPARAGAAAAVMAVALRHEHADALLDPFQLEGFDVLAVDTHAWALARAAAAHAVPDGITALLNIGWNAALMVLVHGGAVVYQRLLEESGMGIVLRAIRDEFKLSDEEAEFVLKNAAAAQGQAQSSTPLAQAQRISELVGHYVEAMLAEIQPAFDYASHRYAEKPLKNLLVCGGASGMGGICEQLSRRVSLATSVLAPTRIAECPASLS